MANVNALVKRKPLPKLRSAIFEEGLTQKETADRAKINYYYLSGAIRGRYILSADERRRLAGVLCRSEVELFGNM